MDNVGKTENIPDGYGRFMDGILFPLASSQRVGDLNVKKEARGLVREMIRDLEPEVIEMIGPQINEFSIYALGFHSGFPEIVSRFKSAVYELDSTLGYLRLEAPRQDEANLLEYSHRLRSILPCERES